MKKVRALGPDFSGRQAKRSFSPARAEAKEVASATAGIPSKQCGGEQRHAPARVAPAGFLGIPPESRLVRTHEGAADV